ncbi:CG8414 [Drosophila busckii]|uniref:Polynucleotide 5'-hydroxyl-kinase NOL9 n=2 Tax=Drosophila busckii TaxID=30019 RepID=A0A0M4EG35_DROBS|nr:CG8414 [Drosophila busckii]
MNSSAESFNNVGTFYDSEQKNGEEDVSDDDSTDFDDLEYMDDSSSEYSLDDDKDFFLKPDVIVADRRGYTPLKFANVDQDEEKLWKSTEDINAEVTKILVYDDIMSETDQNTNQNTDTDAEEDLEEQQDEEDLEKQQFEEEDRFEVQQEEMANEEGQLEEVNIFENSFKNNNVLAVLKSDVELYGTVVVSLLCGRITINGYKAPALELLSIYSPKGFNWISITPMASKKPVKDNYDWSQLQDQFSRAQLDNIRSNYDSQKDAVVLLQRNSSAQQLVNIFSKHMSQNVFPLINATNRPYYASEYLLNCLIQRASGNNTLQVPRAWSKLTFQPESRFILTGGKGVGKSTMLRYLLNRQLKYFPRLLLIDLDIGQPELFVPQTVSCTLIDAPLLGPGFLLNKQPDYAIMVGHVNIVMCAEQYMRAVRKLLVYCHSSSSYENIPWLINTMGYNKGFGYELMSLLINCIQPTDVLQIASTKAINNFDKALDHKNITKVVPIIYTTDEFKLDASELPKYTHHPLLSAVPARQSKSWLMSAKDLRYANLLTRLSAMLRGNAKYITECQPMRVPLSKLHILHLNSTDYTREELIRGMEANVVYLCKHLTDKEPVECLGIGVVRAIDYKKEQLYLVPAMPLASLSQVNCLFMGGDMYLPQSFFKDQGLNVANQVPFVFLIDDCKSSKSIQQIYHRTPGFLGKPANKAD